MKKYAVVITETLAQTVWTEAESPEEAEEKVRDGWERGQYILTQDHIIRVGFDAMNHAEQEETEITEQ